MPDLHTITKVMFYLIAYGFFVVFVLRFVAFGSRKKERDHE